MNKRTKNFLLFLLKVVVSTSLMYLVLKRAGVANVLSSLKNIHPAAFAGAVGLFIFTIFLCSLRWRLLLPERYGLGKVFGLYFMGSFFNTFLPGLVGGDALKIFYLYRETGRGTQAFASVFMDRYMGYFAMMTMGIMAFPFGMGYVKGTWISWALPLTVLAFYLASIMLLWFRIGGGIRLLGEVYGYFHSYRQQRDILVKVFTLSLCVHIVVVFIVYVLCLGLGIDIPLVSLFVFVPIVNTLSALPISLSGVGIREYAMVLLFGTAGVSVPGATAVSFAWFLTMAVGGLGGVVPYLKMKGAKAPS